MKILPMAKEKHGQKVSYEQIEINEGLWSLGKLKIDVKVCIMTAITLIVSYCSFTSCSGLPDSTKTNHVKDLSGRAC